MNYAIVGQDAAGLRFGDRRQTQPPRIDADIARLVEKGIPVYFVQEDAVLRGLDPKEFVPGLRPVAKGAIPRLFAEFDAIWHW